MLINNNDMDFLESVSSKDPVPGGGAVAAYTGAMSAALVEMVSNLTVGKDKYKEVNDEMIEILKVSNILRSQLLKYVDTDSQAFTKVMDAYKLPKNTEKEKIIRKKTIENTTKYATEIPLEVARKSYEIMKLSKKVIKSGNKNAITDGAVSAMMARTSVLSALYNVKINLSSIKDNDYVNKITIEVNELENNVIELEKDILSIVKL
ncbi:MAG: cyclodeaminase/cyclohydrolase family protein [Vallitalea sp.]|jgi:formiminotetrahydrofolate cyclodeaminase|nr:cyclodeaminase/cyclohydrolase family protein [Vallitalea sp.]